MTTALEGGEGSASRPCRSLPPGKTRYPMYRRLVGPQCRSGQVRKISPPPGFDPRTVQPVAIPTTLPGPHYNVHVLVLFVNSSWRRRSAAARLLGFWVRILPRAWMFVVSVVCCQVEVSATSWSLVQRSPTDCGAEPIAHVGPQYHRKN